MKTTLSICAAAIASLLAGHAIAGDSPRSGAPHDAFMRAEDGYVTQDEIQQAHEARREQMKAAFDEKFKAADANNDGKLSLDEVQAKMPRLAQRFTTLDADKDGFLSKEELQHGGPASGGWEHHHKPQQPG